MREWRPPPAPSNPPVVILTLRQSQILSGLCCGLSQQEMADGLGVALNTIKITNRRLYRHMNVHTAKEAISAALTGRLKIMIR